MRFGYRIFVAGFGLVMGAPLSIGQESTYPDVKDARLRQLVNDLANRAPLYRVQKNLRQDDVNRKVPGTGWTPLSFAVAHSNLAAAMMLLKMGADPKVPIGKGKTLLMLAARYGDDNMARVLIRAGVNVNVRDNLGFSAFTYAALQDRYPYHDGYSGVIEELLNQRATSTPVERAYALNLLPVKYNWGIKYSEDSKGNLIKHAVFNDPNLVHIRKIMAKLFAMGVDFNHGIKAKNGFDYEREDGSFGINRTGHPIVFAVRSGDLAMLKMAIHYTPGWKKMVDDPYAKPESLTKLAEDYNNFHIARYLRKQGVK